MLPRTTLIGITLAFIVGVSWTVASPQVEAASTTSAEVQLRLVLKDGTELDIESASIKGKFIHARLPGGSLQAYLIEDVDLDKSRLTTEPTQAPVPTPTPAPGIYLSSATSRTDVDAVWTLTDADVEHILPETEAGEGATEAGEGTRVTAESTTMLSFSGVNQNPSEKGITVSGAVENISGEAISGIVLGAIALDENDSPIGRSRTSLDASLSPGMSSRFSIEIEITSGTPRSVRLTVENPTAPIAVPPPSQPSRPSGSANDTGDGDPSGEDAPPVG